MKPNIKKTLLAFTSIAALSFAAVAAEEKKPAADNTGKNERDRSGETKTPGDQSNSPEDLKNHPGHPAGGRQRQGAHDDG